MIGVRLLMVAAALVVSGTATAQGNGYACNGVVVRFGSRQPLNHTLVTITSNSDRTQEAMFVTGADGRFAFAGLRPGKYRLSAQKEGLGQQLYGGGELGLSTAVVLGPGQNATAMLFEMHAPARLSGTVSDEHGDPVRGQVYLFEKGVFLGRAGVRRVNQEQIKQSGEFSFDQLQPGTYFVAISGRPWFADGGMVTPAAELGQVQGGAENNKGIPVTYYGGTTDPEAATPIELREGGEAKIQITAHSEPTIRVTLDMGMGPEGGEGHGPQITANFAAVGPGGVPVPVQGVFATSANQGFMSGIVPGRYRVSLHRSGTARMQNLGGSTVDLRGDGKIDMTTATRAEISGHLTVEQNAERRGPLSLNLANVMAAMGSMARVSEDGAFAFEDAPAGAGSYELRLLGGQNLHLRSIEASGARYENGRLEVSEGAKVVLAITAGTAVTKVDGIALRGEKPYAGALVLLMAEDPKQATPVYRDQSDADGSFGLGGVWPGHYRVIAIDRGKELAYLDPKVMQPYLRQAQSIEVGPQGLAALKIQVQTRMK